MEISNLNFVTRKKSYSKMATQFKDLNIFQQPPNLKIILKKDT
jgi:hypothetical protein